MTHVILKLPSVSFHRILLKPMKAVLASLLAAVAALASPSAAHAWWNKDYTQRTKVSFNTTAAGVETKSALTGAVVPIRLHSGNFDFLKAKPDGADLRVVATDDKTPLKFRIERFDGANEMAVIWVQVPTMAPGSDKNVVYVYAGNEAAAAQAPDQVQDASTLAVFQFGEKDGSAKDQTGTLHAATPAAIEINGQIGPSAKLSGTALTWEVADKVKASGAGPLTVSFWVKPAAGSGKLYAQGALSMALVGGAVDVSWAGLHLAGGQLPVGAWAHVALSVGAGKATLYVNGASAGQADVPPGLPELQGPVSVGEGFTGLIDQLEVDAAVRSADWVLFNRAAQGADAKLIASVTQGPDDGEPDSGESGYMGVLIKSLTPDAKAVIAILAVMFAVACYVMISKAILINRTDKHNRTFLRSFRDAPDILAVTGGSRESPYSSLARLYEAGIKELVKRDVGHGGKPLSGASMNAVRAAVDADLVQETHDLNARMVLLTIAISGGPFLGLLGTVVGVMITFAAIAAAGDVNVNAIAPGIAAALLATVAGLGVAIPALFGYNYLAARIKNIVSDQQIFVDEFVTRVAESYGAI